MSGLLRRPRFRWLFTVLLSFSSGFLACEIVGTAAAPAVFWPPVGLSLASTMLWGLGHAPAGGLGVALAVLLHGEGPATAGLLGLACQAQAMIGRVVLRRLGVTAQLSELSDLFLLALVGGVFSGMATLPLGYLALEPMDGFWEISLPLQVSSLLFSHLDSVLIFTSLLLCLVNGTCPQPVARHLEGGLVLLALCLLALFLAHPGLLGLEDQPLRPYPLLPFLLWLALRANLRYVALALAWVFALMSTHTAWGYGEGVLLLDEYWIRPLHGFITVISLSFLAVGMLTAMNRRLVMSNLAEAMAQKDALIREVHHRIKNNLQSVAGLLRRQAARRPELEPLMESAISQVQSIAVVHGLHGRVTQQGVMLCDLLPAVCGSIAELSEVPVEFDGVAEGGGNLRIQEHETVAIALILNELVSNAVKHGSPGGEPGGIKVILLREGDGVRVRITNAGALPDNFDFARGEGLGTGLSLVKSLMPSPGLKLEFHDVDGRVLTDLLLEPPLVAATGDRPRPSPDGRR